MKLDTEGMTAGIQNLDLAEEAKNPLSPIHRAILKFIAPGAPNATFLRIPLNECSEPNALFKSLQAQTLKCYATKRCGNLHAFDGAPFWEHMSECKPLRR